MTLGLLKTLVAPTQVWAISYNRLIETLTAHYALQPTKLGQRVNFYDRQRQPHESANKYLAALWKLACKCDFQGLDQALLDQFTRGQTNVKLKHKIIATKTSPSRKQWR